MEPHNALELLVLPVVRGVGGAVAFFVLLRLTTPGLGGLVAIFGGRDGPSAAFFAGPRQTSPARGDRAPLGAPGWWTWPEVVTGIRHDRVCWTSAHTPFGGSPDPWPKTPPSDPRSW